MRQIAALAWKEWHEVRAFLWIGLGVFLGLPIAGGIEALVQYSLRFEVNAMGWVIAFGGVLAVFVAVGATCRDFNGRLEDFWRSRPVGVVPWLLVKYCVGLTVVLISCAVPLLVEHFFNRESQVFPVLIAFPFLWAAIYSQAFLAGCVVGRAAHAAMLGLAGMLLIYFLPLVLPPVEWLNAASLTEPTAGGYRQLWFVLGMLEIAVVVLATALLAVRRGWKIESGQKMMYGSVSGAILILFASAAFRLGTNLPILQQIDLPNGERVQVIRCDGTHGLVITWQQTLALKDAGHGRTEQQYTTKTYSRSLDITATGLKLGSPREIDLQYRYIGFGAWSPQVPEIRYNLDLIAEGDKFVITLRVWHLDTGTEVKTLRLWESDNQNVSWPTILASQNRLFAIGTRLITLDISDPDDPRVLSDQPFGYFSDPPSTIIGSKFILRLPPVPDLSARQRLEAVLPRFGARLDGDLLCDLRNRKLTAYRLTNLTDVSASFQRIGRYEPNMLDSIFGSYGFDGMELKNGLIYLAQGAWERYFNPHVTVFDVNSPRGLRVVGHFAAPGSGMVCPLPDGRAIVAGEKLYLVGPLPHR